MTNIKTIKFISSIIIVLTLFSFIQIKEKELEINKENLKGTYGGDEETENAYCGIYDDSIYYPEPNIRVKYELRKDTIITTDSEDYIEKFIILKLSTDSLILYDISFDMELHLNRRAK